MSWLEGTDEEGMSNSHFSLAAVETAALMMVC